MEKPSKFLCNILSSISPLDTNYKTGKEEKKVLITEEAKRKQIDEDKKEIKAKLKEMDANRKEFIQNIISGKIDATYPHQAR